MGGLSRLCTVLWIWLWNVEFEVGYDFLFGPSHTVARFEDETLTGRSYHLSGREYLEGGGGVEGLKLDTNARAEVARGREGGRDDRHGFR